MLNFTYDIPTKVFFWKRQIEVLASQIKLFWNKVLLTYGWGSIKKIWLYDEVIKILNHNQIQFRELSWIQANPDILSVREWAKICKDNQIQFILAVWWWSVIDASKAISLGAYYQWDSRDIFTWKWNDIKQALPFGTILTLSATASEMDPYMVISNRELSEKRDFGSNLTRPKFSILDPEYTFSVSTKQTTNWIADIMSHVFEQYFSQTTTSYLQDRISESIVKTVIHHGPIAISQPANYESRANIMRAGSLALNWLIWLWKAQDRATHNIEHAVSWVYDFVAHWEWLAIIFPNWMKYVLWNWEDEIILNKFYDFATNIRNVPPSEDKFSIAQKWIESLSNFRKQIWAPFRLSDLNISNPDTVLLASKATIYGDIGWFKRLDKSDVKNILEMCI